MDKIAPKTFKRGIGTHPSGVNGISVECGVGLSVAELAAMIPHSKIGVTTFRKISGNVIRTSGRSLNHATLTGLNPEEISNLLTLTIANPYQQAL